MDKNARAKRMNECVAEMGQLTQHSDLTVAQEQRFRALTSEYDTLEAEQRGEDLSRIRSAADHNPRLHVERGAPDDSGDNRYDAGGDVFTDPESVGLRFRGANPWNMDSIQVFGRSREQVNADIRARALSAIEKMPAATDKIRSAATDMVERFDDKDARLSRTALAASSPAYVRAFAKAATNRLHELREDEQRALDEVRALSLTDTAGGYLVPFQIDPTVIVTANGSRNDIRQIARKVVATGDRWNGVTAGAVAWSWDAEGTEVSDDSPTFAQPSIPVFKANGFVPVSIEAIQDMANGAGEVARLLAEGREILESAAFALGSGVGQPQGIVPGLVGTASVVQSIGSDALSVGDLYGIQNALPARYRSQASWLSTNGFYNRARQFDQNGGGSLWAQLGDDRPGRLLGKPVYEAEEMDASITTGAENYMAVFGDFSNFTIADRIGMTVEFIPHLFSAAHQRPTGQRGWYAYYRTGSGVLNPGGLRILNVT